MKRNQWGCPLLYANKYIQGIPCHNDKPSIGDRPVYDSSEPKKLFNKRYGHFLKWWKSLPCPKYQDAVTTNFHILLF